MIDADAAAARFEALLEHHRPPTGGVGLDEILKQAVPVLPLLCELAADDREDADFQSFEYRELSTGLTLLGRRLGLLDLTPSGALQVVQLTLRAVDPAAEATPQAFEAHAIGAAVEGFVLGREERVEEIAHARAADPVTPLRVDDDVLALIVTGVHDPNAIGAFVDELGRAMLDADARVSIVDLSQLGAPTPDRAAAIFAADEVTRMLGATCIFCGIDDAWRRAAEGARIAFDTIEIAPRFSDAIAVARAQIDRADRPAARGWRALLGRLVGKRSSDARK